MVELDLQSLEGRIESLIQICNELKKENAYLREKQARMLDENTQLLTMHEQAKQRVHGMISRLKELEVDRE